MNTKTQIKLQHLFEIAASDVKSPRGGYGVSYEAVKEMNRVAEENPEAIPDVIAMLAMFGKSGTKAKGAILEAVSVLRSFGLYHDGHEAQALTALHGYAERKSEPYIRFTILKAIADIGKAHASLAQAAITTLEPHTDIHKGTLYKSQEEGPVAWIAQIRQKHATASTPAKQSGQTKAVTGETKAVKDTAQETAEPKAGMPEGYKQYMISPADSVYGSVTHGEFSRAVEGAIPSLNELQKADIVCAESTTAAAKMQEDLSERAAVEIKAAGNDAEGLIKNLGSAVNKTKSEHLKALGQTLQGKLGEYKTEDRFIIVKKFSFSYVVQMPEEVKDKLAARIEGIKIVEHDLDYDALAKRQMETRLDQLAEEVRQAFATAKDAQLRALQNPKAPSWEFGVDGKLGSLERKLEALHQYATENGIDFEEYKEQKFKEQMDKNRVYTSLSYMPYPL